MPLDRWPYFFGLVLEIKLPGKVRPNPSPTTYGSANINIVLDLLSRTRDVSGDIAECGVFRGATLTSLAWSCKKHGYNKRIYGFDSFRGFDERDLEKESERSHDVRREAADFTNNSIAVVKRKLKVAKADDLVTLIPGFFENSLSQAGQVRFSFVHLDCDLGAAYATCLEFFYPRLSRGGILLFDEYQDPIYKDATPAIDRFLSDKPEKIEKIIRDNYIRYYFTKQ